LEIEKKLRDRILKLKNKIDIIKNNSLTTTNGIRIHKTDKKKKKKFFLKNNKKKLKYYFFYKIFFFFLNILYIK